MNELHGSRHVWGEGSRGRGEHAHDGAEHGPEAGVHAAEEAPSEAELSLRDDGQEGHDQRRDRERPPHLEARSEST